MATAPAKLELPATLEQLEQLLHSAACLWEAAENMRNTPGAFGHEGARLFIARNGACEARVQIAALACEAESAWDSLSDDARDGWACPFDWEFVPAWLARRMGWEEGQPCDDPHPNRPPAIGQPLPGFEPRNRTGRGDLGRVAFYAGGQPWAVDDVQSDGAAIAWACPASSVRVLPDRGAFLLSDARGRFARHERRPGSNRKPMPRRFKSREAAGEFALKPALCAAAWEGGPA